MIGYLKDGARRGHEPIFLGDGSRCARPTSSHSDPDVNDRQTLLKRARKRGADLGYVPIAAANASSISK